MADLAGYETTLYMIQRDEPVWGTYYLWYYFIKPIPRMFYPDKGFPNTLAEKWLDVAPDYTYTATGQTSGAVGWAYQQWSWAGIVFEFLFTGWFFRRLEDWRERYRDKPVVLLAYIGFFGILPQLGRDSLIMMIQERWLYQYGIPCAILWLLDRRVKSSRQVSDGRIAFGSPVGGALTSPV
jgi:hypothetical protein